MPEINLFRNAGVQRELPAGEVVFEAGDQAEHLFGIISGSVELHRDGDVLETLGPGGVFGEVALLGDQTRTIGARVSDDAVIAVVDKDEFVRLVKMNAYFALEVMAFMAERLQRGD